MADTERVVADWAMRPLAGFAVTGGSATVVDDGWLCLRGGATAELRAGGVWDLDAYAELAAPVRNPGTTPARVVLVIEDERGDAVPPGRRRAEAVVPPGREPMWLVVALGDERPNPLDAELISLVQKPLEFVRRGAVWGASVTGVSISVTTPDAAVEVGPVIARGVPAPLRELPRQEAFPFIDTWGQYVHREWPGKVHSDNELSDRRGSEDRDLDRHARPEEWDRFGGWRNGPQLEATGFFRVEKIDGVWWMVDPEGKLFWSHGAVRVGTRVRVGTVYRGTPLPDREGFFTLPAPDSPLGMFYDTEPQSTRGYYEGKEGHRVYDFLEANLFRKYGPDWHDAWTQRTQKRLASWGLNTIANSSDPALYLQRKTPYTAVVYSVPLGRNEHRIAASSGNWGKLPDPFDPGLRGLMERTLQTDLKESLNDPWCIGFFVDNELNWGDSCHLAEMTLLSPTSQHAKQAFAADLRERYGRIDSLNAAWNTRHADWNAFLAETALPDRAIPAVRADLEAFSERFLDAYFSCCRESVHAASPNHLYLGCRFAGSANVMVMRAAARHCDVISINRYSRSIADMLLPDGLDCPILIGEFHFSALDRGPFSDGLVPVANQSDRARAYEVYVQSALRNPAVVGTHWFQFYDQPTSGRFDGENFQTGLLDICDTPYEETIAACRKCGNALYAVRSRERTDQ